MKVPFEKNENDKKYLLNFLVDELVKAGAQGNESIINFIVDAIDDDSTKAELTNLLKCKINSTVQLASTSNGSSIQTPFSTDMDKMPIYSNELLSKMKQTIKRLERNRDLTGLKDDVLHFNKSHLGIVKRIFQLQVTQNYLAALKLLIIDDVVKKQTAFNLATEEAIANILNLIDDVMNKLDSRITNSDALVNEHYNKLDSRITNSDALVNEHYNKLDSRITGVDETLRKFLIEAQIDLQNKITNSDALVNEHYNKLDSRITGVDETLRKFLIEAQIDLQNKITNAETLTKISNDNLIFFQEISKIKSEFSWINILELQKIAYYNNSPQTERFTEYLWVSKNLIQKGRLLDVGCVESIFAQELSKAKQLEVYGIDSRPYENPNFNFFMEDVRKMHFEQHYFDQVTIISTLEHIGLPWYDNEDTDEEGDFKAITEISRVLKIGGSVLVTIPYGKGQTNWYRSYNKNRLKKLFSDFKIDEIRYFEQDRVFWNEIDQISAENIDNNKIVKGIALIKAVLRN